jgi:hypothetical protein
MSNYCIYDFSVGGIVFRTRGKTEKHALINLIKTCWEQIDKAETIELLGKHESRGYIMLPNGLHQPGYKVKRDKTKELVDLLKVQQYFNEHPEKDYSFEPGV